MDRQDRRRGNVGGEEGVPVGGDFGGEFRVRLGGEDEGEEGAEGVERHGPALRVRQGQPACHQRRPAEELLEGIREAESNLAEWNLGGLAAGGLHLLENLDNVAHEAVEAGQARCEDGKKLAEVNAADALSCERRDDEAGDEEAGEEGREEVVSRLEEIHHLVCPLRAHRNHTGEEQEHAHKGVRELLDAQDGLHEVLEREVDGHERCHRRGCRQEVVGLFNQVHTSHSRRL
mmetsp:Transcript_23772/g.56792  ORF Transcript_23772/g.56792 Transcript_23772/m.56792 type:complete len:232 (+) Transcript_23772:712-1407(+)